MSGAVQGLATTTARTPVSSLRLLLFGQGLTDIHHRGAEVEAVKAQSHRCNR